MKIFFTLLLVISGLFGYTQAKIVVLGSSTAEGYGATPYFPFPDTDSGWVNRLRLSFNKNTSDGIDTTIVNLAKGGYTTYHVMPTGYTPPPGRPAPDTARNVTKAISLDPDVIIINLPSNDISNGFTKSEIMNNFRSLYQIITSAGINAFITTTQPRDFSPNYLMMQYQYDLKDSIQSNFGYFSINFWDDLAGTNPPHSLRPEVAYGDGIHINNLGHFLVYQRVAAKNLFVVNTILPLQLKSFEAKIQGKKTLLTWETTEEDANTVFTVERSSNGNDYKALGSKNGENINGAVYSFTDADPPAGISFYRLRTNGNSGQKYSPVRQVLHSSGLFSIERVRVNAGEIIADIQSNTDDNALIHLVSTSGYRVQVHQQKLNTPVTQVRMNVNSMPSGIYYLVVTVRNEHLTRPVYLLR